MKHIATMKYIDVMKYRHFAVKAVVLLLALLGTISSNARVFERGERIYFHARPASTDWWANGTYENTTELWALLKDSGSEYWLLASWESSKSNLCYIEIPDGAARNWNTITLARTQKGNRSNIYNSTGDINLNASWDDCYRNYIEDFKENDSYCQWRIVALAPNGNPAEWGASDYQQICTSAAGSDYILAPRDYDYSSNTGCHAWFKYNSGINSWECIQGPDMRETEGDRDCSVALGAAGSDTYYFLQTGKPSACRLVRVHLNQDCSEGAAGACKITNFAAVASDANVTDETCAVDGLVAFDDKHNAGDLMIWCIGVDTVTVVNSEITVPQQFKLEGFDASSTRNYTLHAKFLSGTEACGADYVVTVSPPSTTPTTHTTTGTAADLRLVRFTEEDVELTPDRTDATYFLWTNTDNEEEVTTGSPIHTFVAPTEEKTINYVYLATNMPPVTEPNLISAGGSFNSDGGFSSDYESWGTDLENFYSGGNKGKSGGYAISANSKTFASSYNEVTPYEGSHFGLFDSKSNDGSEDQAAWRVRSTDPEMSDLKVQKGESYLFSFWVANINNYGEMNNGARLQFQISYDGGTSFSALGGLPPIDLSDYRDNRWHGVSAIETASFTSDNVVLRLINLNQSAQNRGNDFALDDIRFEAITSHTSNVSGYEIFPVTYLKCVISGATFEQQHPTACGATSATVNYTVNFVHPRGDLYIYEGTTELAHIANEDLTDATHHIGTLTRPLDGNPHTLTVYFKDSKDFRTDAPTTYSYTAHTIPAVSVKSLSWNTPECDVKTCTLTAEIYYTNQNGILSANVDGGTAVAPVTYNVEKDAQDVVTIAIPGVVADGKTGHKLNLAFDGSHGCSISNHDISTAAPYSPQISSTNYEIQDYNCGDENYKVKITVNFSNGQGKDLTISDGTHTKVLTPASDATSASWTFDMPWEDPVTSHTFKAYFAGKESCKELETHKATFTAPIKPFLNVEKAEIIDPACNSDKYKIDLKYTYRVFKGTTITYKIGSTTIGTETVSGGTDPVTITKTLTSDALVCDGGSHTFSFSTGNAKDCEFSKTFTAPLGNKIESFSVAPIDPVCGDEKYKLRASWEVTAAGEYDELIIARKNGETLTTLETITLTSSNATGNKNLSDSYALDTKPTIVAYLKERGKDCAVTATSDYTTPVVVPAMEFVGIPTFENIVCNESTYELVVPVRYTNQHGKMYAWLDDDTAHKIEITASANCKTGGDYKGYLADAATRTTYIVFSGIKLIGDHEVSVECDGAGSCHLTQALGKAKEFNMPALPKSSVRNKEYSTPACDDETVTLSFDLDYTYQDGELTVWVDGLPKQVVAYDYHLEPTEQTVHVDYEGVPADGADTHKLNYEFATAPSCKIHNIALDATPRSAIITSVTVDGSTLPTKVDCSDVNYTADFLISYKNTDGEKLIIEYKDKIGTVKKTDPITLTGSPQKVTLTLDDMGKGSREVYAYFQGDYFADCHTTPQHTGEYVAPSTSAIDGITATVKKNNSTCDNLKYDIEGAITFGGSPSGNLVVTFDGVEKINTAEYSSPYTYEIKNLTKSGTNLTVSTRFSGEDAECVSTSKAFASPAVPTFTVTEASMSYSTPDCDETESTLTFTIDYVKQTGDLEVWVESASGDIDRRKETYSVDNDAEQHLTLTIDGVSADGKSHKLHVKFSGSGSCGERVFDTPKAPFSPYIHDISSSTTAQACNSDTYTQTIKFTVDNSQNQEITISGKGKTIRQDVTDGVNEIDVSDILRTIDITTDDYFEIFFASADRCSPRKRTTYTEKPKPALVKIVLDADPDDVECSDASYTLTGKLQYRNIDGTPRVWLDESVTKKELSSYIPNNDDVKEITFSLTVPADGQTHTIHADVDGWSSTCAIKKDDYVALWRPQIESITANQPTTFAHCNGSYGVSGRVTFSQGNAQDLIIEYRGNDGTPQTKSYSTALDDAYVDYSISGLEHIGGHTDVIKAYFDGTTICDASKQTKSYTTPTQIIISSFTAEPQPMACDASKYTIKGEITTNAAQSKEIIVKDENNNSTKATLKSGSTTTYEYTLNNVEVSGSGNTLTASFTGVDCYFKTSDLFSAPVKPALVAIVLDADPNPACSETSYTLTGKLQYRNIDGTPRVWLDESVTKKELTDYTPNNDAVKEIAFSLAVPADGQKHIIHADVDGWASTCAIKKDDYTALWRPQIESVTANQPTTFAHCNGSYGVSGFVTFSNGNAQPIIIEYTDKDGNPQTKEYSTAIDATTIPYNITGLDHIGGHQDVIKAYFKGTTICDATKQTAPYTTPTEIVINSFTANVQPKGCNHTQYTIKGELTTNAATSTTLTIKDENNNATTATLKAGSTTTYEYTLNSVVVNGTNKHLTALFEGINCYSKYSELFDEPAMPTAKVEIVTPKQPDCDVTTYELDFEISYEYQPQPGKVTVWVDDHKAEKEFEIQAAQTVSNTLSATLSSADLVADGSAGHVLHFQFAGENACGGSQTGTFTAPRTPQITDIAVTRPDRILCADEHYDATIKVTTRYADGEKVIVKYTDGASVSQETVAYTIPSSGSVEIPVTFDKKDGVSHETIYAYFEGANFTTCQDTEGHKKEFSTPSSSAINDFVVTVHDQTTCDKLLYSLSGIITYGGSASGDMIIAFDDVHTNDTVIPMANCNPVGTPFTLSGLTQPVSSYAISAHFDGETCTSHSQEFNSPAVPAVKLLIPNFEPTVCDVTTTTMHVELEYIKQSGELQLWLDDKTATPMVIPYDSIGKEHLDTVSVDIPITADGKSEHKLYVNFTGATDCHDKSFDLPAFPYSPKILTKQATMEDIACENNTYTLDVTFTVENSQSKDAMLVFRGGTPVTISTTDGTTYHTSFAVTRTFDVTMDDFVEVYFVDNTNCTAKTRIDYIETAKPVASVVSVKANQPACDVTTFTLDFELSYTYQHGDVTVWVDNDEKSKQTFTIPTDSIGQSTAKKLTGTLSHADLVTDGSTGHVLHYQFAGDYACEGMQAGTFDFPVTPLITDVQVTGVPPYIEGLEGTYSPTITVTYQKAVGERIVLEYFNKNDQSQLAYSTTAVSGDGSYEFTGLSFDDVTMGSRTVHAYFEDSDCKTGGNHDGTYTAPTNSSITFESLTLVNTSTCEGLRYNLTGKVSFVGAVVSDLVVEFDATHQYVIPQSQCVAGKALEFAINGVSESIPVEGKTLSAYFSLIPGNVAYSEPVYEPLVPSLDAEIVRVDTIFTCGSKSYTVFLNITSENQRGACFVYDSIAGGTLRRVAKHDGTYNGTDEFTIAMPQRVEEHYIIVRYPNTECVVRFAPISVNPYTKPQPEITLTPIERVCNTATELVLPFAITQGDIAEASLTLTDSKEQTIVSDAELTINATKDTLTYTLPGQLSAGKHTLMVEVRDTLECVATATLPIELALDGQIYSKWNDVLLVDNSQGLYSAYQWYENGQPLSGKTDQVLYLPDGMKGTYTCLLTTPEGKLFTCEYEFEDIPRSADQQFSDNDITVLPNRVKAGGVVAVQQSQSETLRLILMSATGQRIGEYTQTDSKQLICMPVVQGVYLLRITSDSGMQTAKIVVY